MGAQLELTLVPTTDDFRPPRPITVQLHQIWLANLWIEGWVFGCESLLAWFC